MFLNISNFQSKVLLNKRSFYSRFHSSIEVKKSNNGGKSGIQHAILIDFMNSNIKSSLRYKV
jgi:hypothetical protein